MISELRCRTAKAVFTTSVPSLRVEIETGRLRDISPGGSVHGKPRQEAAPQIPAADEAGHHAEKKLLGAVLSVVWSLLQGAEGPLL